MYSPRIGKSGEMDDSNRDQRDFHDQEQQRIKRLYGALPGKAHRLHQQLQVRRLSINFGIPTFTASRSKLNFLTCLRQGRTYFDSGDFALSEAHKASNIGEVQTGTKHPLRRNIPHPSSAVPASSNIESNSDEQCGGTERSTAVSSASHLHQQMTPKRESDEKGMIEK